MPHKVKKNLFSTILQLAGNHVHSNEHDKPSCHTEAEHIDKPILLELDTDESTSEEDAYIEPTPKKLHDR